MRRPASRIFAGQHFRYDEEAGQTLGNQPQFEEPSPEEVPQAAEVPVEQTLQSIGTMVAAKMPRIMTTTMISIMVKAAEFLRDDSVFIASVSC